MHYRWVIEGRPDQPIVTVADAVVEKVGMPQVSHDGLADLFYRDLNIPPDKPVVVDLYKGISTRLGYYNPFSPLIARINALAVLKKDLLLPAILHEGQHMADRLVRPRRFLGWTAARCGVIAGTAGALAFTASKATAAIPTAIVAGAGVALGYTWYVDPLEKDASAAAENSDYLERYRDIISFPEMPL